jgi:LemA protein
MLTEALRSLFAVAEAYPELEADTNFRELQAELARTEDLIAGSRRSYNQAVRDDDTAREVFPSNVVAGAFGFAPREYFAVEDPDAREPVQVEF